MPLPSYASLGINSKCLVDGYQELEPYIAPVITDMAGGNKRARSDAGDELRHFQFNLLFTTAEYTTFRNFVITTLKRGTSRFTMPIWTGTAYETKTVQFTTPFKPNPVPPLKMMVSFDVWVYP